MASGSNRNNGFIWEWIMEKYGSPTTPFTPIQGRTIVGEIKSPETLRQEYKIYKMQKEEADYTRDIERYEREIERLKSLRTKVRFNLAAEISVYREEQEAARAKNVMARDVPPPPRRLLVAASPGDINAPSDALLLVPQNVEHVNEFVRRSSIIAPEAATADMGFEDFLAIINHIYAHGNDPDADPTIDVDTGIAEAADNIQHDISTRASSAAEADEAGREDQQGDDLGDEEGNLEVISLSSEEDPNEESSDEEKSSDDEKTSDAGNTDSEDGDASEEGDKDADDGSSKDMAGGSTITGFAARYDGIIKELHGLYAFNMYVRRVMKFGHKYKCLDCPDKSLKDSQSIIEHRASIHSLAGMTIPATCHQLSMLAASIFHYQPSEHVIIFYCPFIGCDFISKAHGALRTHLQKEHMEKKSGVDMEAVKELFDIFLDAKTNSAQK